MKLGNLNLASNLILLKIFTEKWSLKLTFRLLMNIMLNQKEPMIWELTNLLAIPNKNFLLFFWTQNHTILNGKMSMKLLNRLVLQLTGLLKVWCLQSKIKVDVAHVGPSVLLELWNRSPWWKEEMPGFHNNSWLTAQENMEIMDVVEASIIKVLLLSRIMVLHLKVNIPM